MRILVALSLLTAFLHAAPPLAAQTDADARAPDAGSLLALPFARPQHPGSGPHTTAPLAAAIAGRQAPAGTGRMALWGLAGGAIGAVAGGFAGAHIGDEWDCTFEQWVCAVQGGAIGAVIGESVLLPLGVHLADDRRGNYIAGLGAALGIGVLGALAAYQLDVPGGPVVLAATPLLQLAATIAIERHTR